jgi:hypothetical protein
LFSYKFGEKAGDVRFFTKLIKEGIAAAGGSRKALFRSSELSA